MYKPTCNKGRRSVFMVKQLKLTTSSRVTSFTVTYLPLGGMERFALRLNAACQSMQLIFTAVVTEQLPLQLFVKFVQTLTCCKQINCNSPLAWHSHKSLRVVLVYFYRNKSDIVYEKYTRIYELHYFKQYWSFSCNINYF